MKPGSSLPGFILFKVMSNSPSSVWRAFASGKLLRATFPARPDKVFSLTVLTTPEEQQEGFMFKEQPSDSEGLYFKYGRSGIQGFWMKNVSFDLDLVSLDSDLRVMEVTRLKAGDETSVVLRAPTANVLELRSGTCLKYGIRPGVRMTVISSSSL